MEFTLIAINTLQNQGLLKSREKQTERKEQGNWERHQWNRNLVVLEMSSAREVEKAFHQTLFFIMELQWLPGIILFNLFPLLKSSFREGRDLIPFLLYSQFLEHSTHSNIYGMQEWILNWIKHECSFSMVVNLNHSKN